jgi:hypothetical protein
MKERDDYSIQLYRGLDQKFFGIMPFLPIVQESLEKLLGRYLVLESVQIILLQIPEEPMDMESPMVENLVPEFGYTYVRVYQGNLLIYRHPHRLYDVVTQTLQKKLSLQYPEEKWWGFRVDVPGIPPITAFRLNYRVPQSIDQPRFQIRRLAEEEPAIKTLADFGVKTASAETTAPVKIVFKRSLYQDLCEQRPLSPKVEEGGFLIGNVYRDGDGEDTYLLEVSNALTAQHTGASFLHLTFTGDSFVEVKRTLNQNYPGERLLGWYHTHLFPATPTFGLSSIDVELHFSTFTIPWQLAGLINLDGNQRTLRFYVRQGNKMVLCPYWVIVDTPIS